MNKLNIRRTLLVLVLLCCGCDHAQTGDQDTSVSYDASDCFSHRDGTPALVVFCLGHNLPLTTPYHVGGCLRGRDVDPRLGEPMTLSDGEIIQLRVAEDAFLTYTEAHDYVRTASRQYPNATFTLDRIVSYETDPGIVSLNRSLTEADTLEWWTNGYVTIRTFPPSRACGNAVSVRAHIMPRRCRD